MLSSVHALSVVNILHNALTLYKRVVGSKQQCSPSQRWAGETHTHTHTHTYIPTHTHTRTHIHTHTHTHKWVSKPTRTHAHKQVCTHPHTQNKSTCMHKLTHTHTHTSKSARAYTHHTHTHTPHTHAHTHTQTVLCSVKNSCKTGHKFSVGYLTHRYFNSGFYCHMWFSTNHCIAMNDGWESKWSVSVMIGFKILYNFLGQNNDKHEEFQTA